MGSRDRKAYSIIDGVNGHKKIIVSDSRIDKLAKFVTNDSCVLIPGERVLIEAAGLVNEIVIALIGEANRLAARSLSVLRVIKSSARYATVTVKMTLGQWLIVSFIH